MQEILTKNREDIATKLPFKQTFVELTIETCNTIEENLEEKFDAIANETYIFSHARVDTIVNHLVKTI